MADVCVLQRITKPGRSQGHTAKAALGTNYAHNAFGERVCKSTSGPTCATSPLRTEYVYDDDGHLIGEYAPNLIDHIEILWLADTPIAVLKRRPGSTDGGPSGGGTATPWTGTPAGGVDIYFIHPDHLDSPRAVVNANDQPIWLWDSAPFGDTAANEQPTGGLPNFTFNLRFPGQQYDRETGTHYNYFRDYEAGSGRYVQSDPVGLDAGSLSAFPYADSDPTGVFDEFGLTAVRRYKGCNIYGSPQRTRGANGARHAAESLKEARAQAQAAAKKGVSVDIHLNQQLDTSVGMGGKERPDVLTKHPTGEIDMCEICSPRQDVPGQLAKEALMRAKMGGPPGVDSAR